MTKQRTPNAELAYEVLDTIKANQSRFDMSFFALVARKALNITLDDARYLFYGDPHPDHGNTPLDLWGRNSIPDLETVIANVFGPDPRLEEPEPERPAEAMIWPADQELTILDRDNDIVILSFEELRRINNQVLLARVNALDDGPLTDALKPLLQRLIMAYDN